MGRSGAGAVGLSPLSYSTVADWARLMGIRPEPWEIEALMEIDAVILDPGTNEPQEAPEPVAHPAWPVRKDG